MKKEVSFTEYKNNGDKVYIVTRRLPDFSVAETKRFKNKQEALALFNEWLE